MKSEMASLDLAFAVKEAKEAEGARVENVFQEGRQVHLTLHLPGRGTRTLVAGEGMFFLSERTPVHAKVPTNFAMYLRKYLRRKKIKSISQPGFDRIAYVEFEDNKLIFEIFREGNAVFVSPAGKIYSVMTHEAWSARTLKNGEIYAPPPSGPDPRGLSMDDFFSALDSQKQIVAFLAREMSLGGTYAEEACLRANVQKTRPCDTLAREERARVFNAMNSMFAEKPSPAIILEGNKYADAVPFGLRRYEGFFSKTFKSFNVALEEYFLKGIEAKKEAVAQKEVSSKMKKLEVRKKEQEDAIQRLEGEEKTLVRAAEIVNEKYSEFEDILSRVQKAGLKNAKSVSEKIKSVDEKLKIISVDTDGATVALNANKSLAENAGDMYSRAKVMRQKIIRAKEALARTGEFMRFEETQLHSEEKPAHEAKVEGKEVEIEKKEWYHKFRWFISSSGLVVAGGRDATSNEILVKKHTEKGDLVFHTDIAGSPFVIIKSGGREIDEKTILEAAQFAACYSRAWKQGVGSLDVFYAEPEQVTKKTPSGEYMGHGSFMVYGKKEWVKTELRLAAGFFGGHFVVGPVSSVLEKTKKHVLFGPGTTPAKDIAKQIKAEIFRVSSKEEQEALRKLGTEEIQSGVPYGSGDIVKR